MSSLFESLFAGDPFFERSRVLWPLYRGGALSDMREDFAQRRSAMTDSFLKELSAVFPYDFLKGGSFASSSSSSSSSSSRLAGRCAGGEVRRLSSDGNLELSLDVREFAPEDITVKLAGRELAVVAAAKPSGESSPAGRKGFVQKIGLPESVDPSAITCSLTTDGLLKIEAPAAPRGSSEERTVPIRFRTSLNFPVNSKEDGSDVPEKSG